MTGEELDKLYLRALEGVVQPRDLITVIDLLRESRRREEGLKEALAIYTTRRLLE